MRVRSPPHLRVGGPGNAAFGRRLTGRHHYHVQKISPSLKIQNRLVLNDSFFFPLLLFPFFTQFLSSTLTVVHVSTYTCQHSLLTCKYQPLTLSKGTVNPLVIYIY